MIPSSLLNFIAGLAAGAGINLLTSVSGSSDRSRPLTAGDSAIWVIAAAFLAYAGYLSNEAERAAAMVIDNTLTKSERKAVVRNEQLQVRWRYRAAICLSALGLIAAVVLIPGLAI
jgi:hypothetical protein